MSGERPLETLSRLEKSGLLRHLSISDSNELGQIERPGKRLWNYASNDYLGLSQCETVKNAFCEGIARYGTGAGASRLVSGTKSPHQSLEEKLAESKKAESALSFSSGYSTALSVIPAVIGHGDIIYLDRLCHASLFDGAKLSGATLRVFPHNDHKRLAELVRKTRSLNSQQRVLVVTESVFSMDGDICPLKEILAICEDYGALSLLDEAHGIGVLGKKGGGLAEQLGVHDRIDFQMGTLSKAVGLAGAYVAAKREWIDLFINQARPFIYTTAAPPAMAAAACAALDLIASEQGAALRQLLWRNVETLRRGSPSPIIPYQIGSDKAVTQIAADLEAEGYLLAAIRYPTVPRGTARLRLTASSLQNPQATQKLASLLAEIENNIAAS